MNEQQMIIAIFAIASGLGFATFFFTQIFKIARLSIEKRHAASAETRDMQLREEFVKFRRQIEQRMQTLEGKSLSPESSQIKQPEAPRVQVPEISDETEVESRLPNMLKQRG